MTIHRYLLITSYYPAAYRICMFHRIMRLNQIENYDHFSASMRVYCIHDGTKKKNIHQLLLVYLANQSTLPIFMTYQNKKKRRKTTSRVTSIIDQQQSQLFVSVYIRSSKKKFTIAVFRFFFVHHCNNTKKIT